MPSSRSRTRRAPAHASKPLKPKWFQILLALADRDRHGLEIVREVERSTEGAMRLWPGTLYGALEELAAAGWIQEVDPPADAPGDGNPRYFRLTTAGGEAVRTEVQRLERLLRDARSKVASSRTR